MTRVLERQKVGQARVIPILIRAADLANSPLAHLHILPTDARPLASWPDVDIAIADITQSIRQIIAKELPQHSVNTSGPAFPRIWDIPYPHNPYFTGREEVLSQLATDLQVAHSVALSHPQAITGLGGIGKTQIAVECGLSLL